MAIRVETETSRGGSRVEVCFRDDDKPDFGYWLLKVDTERSGRTWYTITHDGWVKWEGTVCPGSGRAFCTHGKRAALPPFLRSHLPELLRPLVKGQIERFEADPPPYWAH